jgi:hypothetical protein
VEGTIYTISLYFDIVAIVGSFLVWIFKLAPTNFDNALYFISALVQSQAVIVSIVITLIRIAIQIDTASYTHHMYNREAGFIGLLSSIHEQGTRAHNTYYTNPTIL